MAVAQGYGKTVTSGSVFAYDVADTRNSYRGEPTTNLNPYTLSDSGTDGSGQGTVGTRTILSSNHVSINDVNANTRQTHLISGLTGGATYTVSIEFKKISGTPTFRFQLQNYLNGAFNGTIKFTDTAEIGIEDKEGWQLASWTFTLGVGMNGLRIWYQDGADYTTYTHAFELRNPQLEQKSHATPYTPPGTTRSATQGLLPLVGNSTIDLTNVSFDSNAQMTFDGTDDLIDITTNFGTLSAYTFEYVAYANSTHNMPIASRTNTNFYKYGAYSWRYTHGGVGGEFYHTAGNGTGWAHWAITYDGSTISVWENGVSKGTSSSSGTADFSGGIRIGSWASSAAYTWDGTIPIMKMYNRALSAGEVRQNYLHYKTRFNLS